MDKILVQIEARVATIKLNRPEKLNAIDSEMLDGLEAAAARIDGSDEVRAVVLAGAGERAFSVGADIKAWSSLEPLEMWRWWVRVGHRVFARLASLRQPLIAAIDGYALGGGLELAMAADLRLASERAELGMPEATIGTAPGWNGSQRLVSLVGPARAKQLVLTGARIDAKTAERWGLVNKVVSDGSLMEHAQRLAGEISSHPPLSVQVGKQLIDAAISHSVASSEALAGSLLATHGEGQAYSRGSRR
jgi:enoyl-CoA hydratase